MIKYDKLKNLDTFEDKFEFICSNCKANGMKKGVFDMMPGGISWKPDFIDNSDIKNKDIRKAYDALPTKRQALLLAYNNLSDGKYILIHCNKCDEHISLHDKMSLPDLRKWISKNLNTAIDLRIKQVE